MKRFLFLMVCSILAISSDATHLLRGYMGYTYLGSTNGKSTYNVTITLFRDCSKDYTVGEVRFDNQINLCCYNSNNLFSSYSVNLKQEKPVREAGTKCGAGWNSCINMGIYETTISLPNSTNGYVLKWERCCSRDFSNLKNNALGYPYQGETLLGMIPNKALHNSLPAFDAVPVIAICVNDTVKIDQVFKDKDGDSLSYKLVTPWQGANTGDPNPLCDSNYNAPYNVDYVAGFSFTKPFGTGSVAQIDAKTGTCTFFSPNTGYFALTVEVTEWRRDTLISRNRIDEAVIVTDIPFSGVKENKYKNAIDLFPNPANGSVRIRAEEPKEFTWQILDISGKKILQGKGTANVDLNVADIANGTYFIQVKQGEILRNIPLHIVH